jgi:RimJ/RimL family protein N-acetyltransferase
MQPGASLDHALPRTTDRLVLRRFVAGDLAPFQSYRCDPEVGRYQGWSTMDDKGAAAFIAGMAVARIGVPGEWFQIAVAEKSTGVLVGDIGIGIDPNRTEVAEIGFSMEPAAQRRGLGSEAVMAALALLFDSAKVDVVEGITDARNIPSIRLLERVGMRLDRMQETLFKGELCTEHVYSLTRAQWQKQVAPLASNYPR